MLTTKRINLGISVCSRALRFFIIFYIAFILAKCVWWVLSPANNNIFIEWADLDPQDKATKYINNRYPFGTIVVVKEREPEKPKIADLVKLTGIYLNPDKDSFAFVEYQGKSSIVKIGDSIIGSNAQVKTITSNNIVIVEDGHVATVELTAGGSSSNNPSTNNSSRGSNSMFGASNKFGNQNRFSNSSNSSSNQQNKPLDQGSQKSTSDNNDLKDNRKKLVDDFIKTNPFEKVESPAANNGNSNKN